MQKWEDAVDTWLDLYTFINSPFGANFIQGYAESMQAKTVEHQVGIPAFLKNFSSHLRYMLFDADPIYVDPDIMTIYEAAVKTFKPEPLAETDLIIPNGFILLPRPMMVSDIHHELISYRAINWKQVPEGIVATYWGSIHDMIDLETSPKAKEFGYQVLQAYKGPNRLILSHVMPWKFGEIFPNSDEDGDPYNVVRQSQCLWRLMMQTITVQNKARPNSAVRGRLKRANLPERNVLIVKLRRPHNENKDHEPKNVEWSHRWIVEGHWRNQWFPSINKHRQIWISRYVKGPEDKPLELNRIRVFELVR